MAVGAQDRGVPGGSLGHVRRMGAHTNRRRRSRAIEALGWRIAGVFAMTIYRAASLLVGVWRPRVIRR